MAKTKELLFDPVVNDNPIALRVLGICSALAVTSVCLWRLSCRWRLLR